MAEYAQNLIRYCPQHEFKICDKLTDQGITESSHDCNLVHMLYEPSVYRIYARRWGKPTVMTCFNGPDQMATMIADRIVVHRNDIPGERVRSIPLGIPTGKIATEKPENLVGLIGFPFDWKGMDKIAEAATRLGMGVLAICPPHPWYRRDESLIGMLRIREKAPTAEIYAEWLEFDEVFQKLGRCKLTCFAYQNDNGAGISSSVRYGLATGRPCVVTNDPMYSDLFPYEDEIIFLNPRPMVESLMMGLEIASRENAPRPKRILEDMNWNKCGEQYSQVYKEIAA